MSDTIIAFISGSIVAIIASLLAHFFSIHRDRRKEFSVDWVKNLRESHPTHSDSLTKKTKRNFKKAWQDYCHPDGEYNSRPLSAYGKDISNGTFRFFLMIAGNQFVY